MTGSLLDWMESPKGDASRVACFLDGGRYSGDRGSIVPPAPDVLVVFPCDCSPLSLERVCGQRTHWAPLDMADALGDTPRHSAYYVLVETRPALSGMVSALYWSVGHERPTRREIAQARNHFDRIVRQVAARAARKQKPPPEGE